MMEEMMEETLFVAEGAMMDVAVVRSDGDIYIKAVVYSRKGMEEPARTARLYIPEDAAEAMAKALRSRE